MAPGRRAAVAEAAEALRQPIDIDPDWEDWARCKGADAALFFPERGRTGHEQVSAAGSFCRWCPVRLQCLATATVVRHEPHGIWGGLTATERRAVRARLRASGVSLPAAAGR